LNQDNYEVIFCRDPGASNIKKMKPLNGYPDFNKSNQKRQYYLISQGIDHMRQNGITHVLKIRTDQKMDLKLLYREFRNFVLSGDKKLFVPYLFNPKEDKIPDFYLGGEINYFDKLCNLMISDEVIISTSPHRELFYKTLMLEDYWSHGILYGDFYSIKKQNERKSKIINFVSGVIYPGSKKLYESVFWRGSNVQLLKRENFTSKKANDLYIKSKVLNIVDFDKFFLSSIGTNSLVQILIQISSFKLKRFTRNAIDFFKSKSLYRLVSTLIKLFVR
jgi:hypothetical protein